MPDRPLLLFPVPDTAGRTKRTSGPGNTHNPSHARQSERLLPMFKQLQSAFEKRQAEVQRTAVGAIPEQVLVIETIGSVENFVKAIKHIKGLEWMSEVEIDVDPDQDFFDKTNTEKKLGGRLYLIMTNHRSLQQLLSLWGKYSEDPELEFGRGLTPFRNMFKYLKNIRLWGLRDRIDETGIMDDWKESLNNDGNRPVKCEVELWFHDAKSKRVESREQIGMKIKELGGSILDECTLDDIAYHALLAEIPAMEARKIIDNPEVNLFKCEDVMFFRPVGQTIADERYEEESPSTSECLPPFDSVPSSAPIVAILDGLPLENHEQIQDRLFIDDPDDCASEYPVLSRKHGTAMASLILHGDLEDSSSSLKHKVYMRPIMKSRQFNNEYAEVIPDDFLLVDCIHKAIRRIFEGEGTADAYAPTVRIVNLSIGDLHRQFTQLISPLARLLDWMSMKYNVLFIVSAGNHRSLQIGMPIEKFESLSNDEKEGEIIRAVHSDARNRKILSPGESINSLTVGALNKDSSAPEVIGTNVNLFESPLLSPLSALGSGYRRSIKPDLLFNGGKIKYSALPCGNGNTSIDFRPYPSQPPGNKVAAPSLKEGKVNNTCYVSGTSNSAALISRMAAHCYDTLSEIFEEQAPDIEIGDYLTPLIKAMIIHGCSWGEIEDRLSSILRTSDKNEISRCLGYGVPDAKRILECAEQRATLLGFGHLEKEQAHIFSLPLPVALAASKTLRTLTITLAWISPVASTTQRYRTAKLWFEAVQNKRNILGVHRQQADMYTAQRGTVQHEIFEGDRAVAFADGDMIQIKVNCREDAQKLTDSVPYGLAVTLEVAEGIDIPIYDDIRDRIASVVEIQAAE